MIQSSAFARLTISAMLLFTVLQTPWAQAYPPPAKYAELETVSSDLRSDTAQVVSEAKYAFKPGDTWGQQAIQSWERFAQSTRYFELSCRKPADQAQVESDYKWLLQDWSWADNDTWNLPGYHSGGFLQMYLSRVQDEMSHLAVLFK